MFDNSYRVVVEQRIRIHGAQSNELYKHHVSMRATS